MVGVDAKQPELFFRRLGDDFRVLQGGLRTHFGVFRNFQTALGDRAIFEQNLGAIELYFR